MKIGWLGVSVKMLEKVDGGYGRGKRMVLCKDGKMNRLAVCSAGLNNGTGSQCTAIILKIWLGDCDQRKTL